MSPTSDTGYPQLGGTGWNRHRECTLRVEVKGPLPISRILIKELLGGKLCKNNQEKGNYRKTITSGQLFPDHSADLNIKLFFFFFFLEKASQGFTSGLRKTAVSEAKVRREKNIVRSKENIIFNHTQKMELLLIIKVLCRR